MTALPYTLVATGISVFLSDRIVTINSDTRNYAEIVKAVKEGDAELVNRLMEPERAAQQYLSESTSMEIFGGIVHIDGRAMPAAVSDKVLRMMDAGIDAKPLENVCRNFLQNPSAVALEEGFLFCTANDFLIDEQGFIICYKYVTNDYKDCYTKKIDNRVGQRPSMPRNAVDDRRNNTCSHGLHVGAYGYVYKYGLVEGQRMMIVRVHPKDIVSVPADYGDMKMRVSEYEVIGEQTNWQELERKEVYSTREVNTWRGVEEEDDDGNEWDLENDEGEWADEGHSMDWED